MSISVTEPLGHAWQRMVRVLFAPFSLGKWFTLGFCAFLASCGESGFQFNGNYGGGSTGGSGGGGGGGIGSAFQWIQSNLMLVALIGIGVVAVILAVAALILWLQSRGKFMLIDGLVLNRGAVVEPWRAFRDAANSLFLFKFTTAALSICLTVGILAISATIIWPDLTQGVWTGRTTTALVLSIATISLVSATYMLIALLLEDFVAPAMYLHGTSVMDAWSTVNQDVFKGHFWVLTLFYLMRFLVSFAGGIIAFFAMCATCCIAGLPYIGTVVLLPVIVFQRWYSLCFLEQFGPGWRFFAPEDSPPTCPTCYYDLRGNPQATTCPECGTSLQMPAQPAPQPDV